MQIYKYFSKYQNNYGNILWIQIFFVNLHHGKVIPELFVSEKWAFP